VDWTRVDGMDVQVAQSVIAEVGVDLNEFATEKHFTHWLGLCPTNQTSGGRVLNRGTPKVVNRAKVAFRQAATTLLRSQSYLGAQYRHWRACFIDS
jgi:transposase